MAHSHCKPFFFYLLYTVSATCSTGINEKFFVCENAYHAVSVLYSHSQTICEGGNIILLEFYVSIIGPEVELTHHDYYERVRYSLLFMHSSTKTTPRAVY